MASFALYFILMKNILSKIQQIYIKLEAEEETVLSLMLSASGSLNRMGDGSGDSEFGRFFMGNTQKPLFKKLIQSINPKVFELAGRYELPYESGEHINLTIHCKGDDLDTGFEFSFGSESMGPPEEILAIVEKAVELTDGWYEEQLEKNRRN